MEDGQMPSDVAEDILRRYGDVLRVGQLRVGNEVVTWDTETTSELQLQNFFKSFHKKLQELLPGLARRAPDVLRLAPFWLCKAVSINYVLIEVLLLIKERVGVMCTIETRSQGGGPLVEYGVDIMADDMLQVTLDWRNCNNLVYRNPETAEKQVKGTISQLVTQFCLPPEHGFAPAYGLQLRLKRSLARKFAMRIACGSENKVLVNEAVHLDEPLRSSDALDQESQAALATRFDQGSRPSHALHTACHPDDNSPSAPLLEDKLPVTGRRASAVGPEIARNSDHAKSSVGRLRVQILRACGLQVDQAYGGGHDMYALCSLGKRVLRTRAVPPSSSPKWLQALEFPVMAQDLRSEVLIEIFGEGTCCKGLDLLGRVLVPVTLALEGSGVQAVTRTLDELLGSTVEFELELLPEANNNGDCMIKDVDDTSDDDCVVEVGTPFASMSRVVSFGAMSSTTTDITAPASRAVSRSSSSFATSGVTVRVHGGDTGPSGSSGIWCTRPCVSK